MNLFFCLNFELLFGEFWNLAVLLVLMILFNPSLVNSKDVTELAEAERKEAKHGVLVEFALSSTTPQTTTSQPVKALGEPEFKTGPMSSQATKQNQIS